MNSTRATRLKSGEYAAKGDLSKEQILNQSLPETSQSVNDSDNNFITPEDIERFNQSAYHGTRHKLEGNKFDLDKIGSGEGAQAYGWGIYLAENRGVSEDYRDAGRSRKDVNLRFVTKNGDIHEVSVTQRHGAWNINDPKYRSEYNQLLKNVMSRLGQQLLYSPNATLEQLKEKVRRIYEHTIEAAKTKAAELQEQINSKKRGHRKLKEDLKVYQGSIEQYSQKIEALNEIVSMSFDGIGNLYKFEGVPENEDLLDWDAPLEEQPKNVQEALKKIARGLKRFGFKGKDILGNPEGGSMLSEDDNVATGRNIYKNIANALHSWTESKTPIPFLGNKKLNNSQQAASMLLNKYGVPGLRYWDQSSRNKEDGTHNFVIWNTKTLKAIGISSDSDKEAKEYFKRGGENQYKMFEDEKLEIFNQAAQRTSTPRHENVTNFNSLIDLAKKSEGEFHKKMRELQNELGGELKERSTMKREARIREKVHMDYKDDFSRCVDVWGGSLIFDNEKDLLKALKKLDARDDVVRLKDKWNNPDDSGYRDINANIMLPNGFVVELQLHHKGIMDVKDGLGHLLYEFVRVNTNKAEFDSAIKQVKEISKNFYNAGINGTYQTIEANLKASLFEIARALSSQTSAREAGTLVNDLSELTRKTLVPNSSESPSTAHREETSGSLSRNSTANGTSSPFSKYRNINKTSNNINADSIANNEGEDNKEVYNQIGIKRKNEMNASLIKNRPDMTKEQRENAILEIEKLGEATKNGGNPKIEKAATKWLVNGHIILPEDNYKIIDAVRICEQEHIDPMRFADPNEILVKYTIKETKAEKRINPDTVPEFSNKKEYEHGITVYTVQDDKEGQKAVRKIIDTHWGEKANPWCLAARNNNAWEMWEHYSKTEKRIAFKNGKLLAFNASDSDEIEWWDKQDKSFWGIPYGGKENNDTVIYVYNEDSRKKQKFKERLSDGTIITYDKDGSMLNRQSPEYYENGQLKAEPFLGGEYREYYENGQLWVESLHDGSYREYRETGELRSEELTDGTYRTYYENGQLWKEESHNGSSREYYENGQLREEILPNVALRKYYENGQLKEEQRPDGEELRYHENGQLALKESPDGNAIAYYENGQLAYEKQNNEFLYIYNEEGRRIYPVDRNIEFYNQAAYNPRGFFSRIFKRIADNLHGRDIEERAMGVSSSPALQEDTSFENKESEQRYRIATKGIKKAGVLARVKHAVFSMGKSMSTAYPEFSGNKDLLPAQVEFEKLERAKRLASKEAMKSINDNLKDLSDYDFDLFVRKRLLDNLNWFKEQNPDAELPFGFNDNMLKKEHQRFTTLAEQRPAVMKAIQNEERRIANTTREFTRLAKNLGMNVDNVFKNPHYYHHSVLQYATTAAAGRNSQIAPAPQNTSSLQQAIDTRLNEIRNRNFMKKRKGSTLDINMNYFQAMGEVEAQMRMDNETMKTLIAIKQKYDKAPELRAALKQAFNKAQKSGQESYSQGEGFNLSDIIPEGYTLYNPAGSRLIQSANTAAENVLAMALDDASEETGLPLDEIINSMGANNDEILNQLWVIPTQIKEHLKRMSRGRDRGMLGKTAKSLTTLWKQAVLFSPTRNLKYNFRNFTGDLDAVIAGNPSALKYFGRAVKELTAHYRGKGTTKDLQDFIQQSGGLDIQSFSMSDSELRNLERLLEQNRENKTLPKKAWGLIKTLWSREKTFTEWRENILRYAAYLDYLQQMNENKGTPSSWGASNKDEVMALSDLKERAFKMSNELLGDYDNISEAGKQLREFAVPFYSWWEVNAKRYYRILRNGIKGDNGSNFAKRVLLGQAANVPYYAMTTAETVAKIALLSMVVQMFNRMVFGDDDDELPEAVKFRPHLTLGKHNGKVYYFDRIGALADVADWISLDSVFLDTKEIMNGQQTLGGYLQKMAKAPVSKAISGLNPIIKMPFELTTKRSTYPDAFNSRTIRDRGEYVAQTLGLSWPYKAIAGTPRSDADEFTKLLLYSVDPDEAAYYQTLDKVRQFKERVLDKHFDGIATTKRGEILWKLKQAMRYKDRAAVRRYLQEYKKLDGTKQGLKQSMKAMDPLFGLNAKEKAQFLKWIKEDDRKYLRRANKYFHELADKYTK